LHRYWKETNFLLKSYLIIAVISLMAITSLGIFGFLTSTYQESHVKIEMIDSKKQMLETKKTSITEQIDVNKKRIDVLNDIRISQEQRVREAGNYKLPREQAYAAIEKANSELNELNEMILNLVFKTTNISESGKINEDMKTRIVTHIDNLNVPTTSKYYEVIMMIRNLEIGSDLTLIRDAIQQFR
jgi:hypothetical protein